MIHSCNAQHESKDTDNSKSSLSWSWSSSWSLKYVPASCSNDALLGCCHWKSRYPSQSPFMAPKTSSAVSKLDVSQCSHKIETAMECLQASHNPHGSAGDPQHDHEGASMSQPGSARFVLELKGLGRESESRSWRPPVSP